MSRFLDYRQYRVVSHIDEAKSQQLIDAILNDSLVREKIFRDNWRTLSVRVRFDHESLLLKVPRARNGRRWERFLTLFRESDALRTFLHLQKLSSMGFSTPDPVLACECRRKGVVVDSFVCYRFVEGRPATSEDAYQILAVLRALHQQGYLRSDAQLANFVVAGDEVTFIDFRLKKPWFLPRLQKARELDRFLRSCPDARRFLSTEEATSGWLRLASFMENASFGFRDLKRRVRKRRKVKSRSAQK